MKIVTQVKKLLVLVLLFNSVFLYRLNSENSNEVNNSIREEEEMESEIAGKLNGKIYLKGLAEKHKKVHSTSTATATTTSKKKEESKEKIKLTDNNQPTGNTKVMKYDSPILAEKWVKYFKYTNSELNVKTPKNFFVNSGYYSQTRLYPNVDFTKGKEFIRNKNYFYLSVFKDAFVFNSSKKIQMQRNIDSLSISDIGKIYEKENVPKGGIEDFGNFEEGFCLKFNTMDIKRTIYILCFESKGEKTEIKNLARALKIEEQHKNGIYLIDNGPNALEQKESISSLLGPKTERTKDLLEKPTDGYWIILQNWSQCNLKCGGGTSTLQRMCIPHKKGGKPCEGKSILTKECNSQPCPKAYSTSENIENKKNTEVMKPIVKVMAFTNSPQRYTLCKIKESDMMIYFQADDPNLYSSKLMNNRKLEPGMKDISVPSRVIMNNSTLSIFTGEHYETLYQTYILKKSLFNINKSQKGCFVVKESKKKITLCPFGCERDDKEQKQWAIDFDLFKNKCGRSSPYKIEEDAELLKKIQDKMNEARQTVIDENVKTNQIKAFNQESNMSIIEKETTTTAMKAIQKELNIEDLIKQEEEERNRKEELKIKMQIDLEMKKKQCVIKAIKEKKLENEQIAKTFETKKRIESIRESAAAEVLKRRNKLKETIDKIRKRSEMKRNNLNQRLFEVRTSIASEIGKAYKKGDKNKCVVANDSSKKRNNYCIANYSEDFSFLNYCKSSDDFCEICCNNEFGDMHEDEKENCLKEVCPLKKFDDEDDKSIYDNNKDSTKDKNGRCITEKNGNFLYQKKISVK